MEVWGSRAKLCALYTRFNFVTPRGGHTCQVEEPPELGWVHHWAQRSDQSSRGALEEELPERKNGSDLPEVTAVPSALWRFSVVPGRPVRLELSVLKVPPPPKPESNHAWQICWSGSSAESPESEQLSKRKERCTKTPLALLKEIHFAHSGLLE